jgi:Domain of unknown function (DUF3850)
MRHELKCWPVFFNKVLSGEKTFEVRRDDRTPPFAVGDVLRLCEWDPTLGLYTGASLDLPVTYVLRGDGGVAPGFVVMGFQPPSAQAPRPTSGEAMLRVILDSERQDRDRARIALEAERQTVKALRASLITADQALTSARIDLDQANKDRAQAIETANIANLAREEARRELALDDQRIDELNKLLDLFPCPAHGRCVPFAIQSVERLRKAAVQLLDNHDIHYWRKATEQAEKARHGWVAAAKDAAARATKAEDKRDQARRAWSFLRYEVDARRVDIMNGLPARPEMWTSEDRARNGELVGLSLFLIDRAFLEVGKALDVLDEATGKAAQTTKSGRYFDATTGLWMAPEPPAGESAK